MVSVELPVFVSVTTLAVLVVPTAWFPKSKLVGQRVAAGAVDAKPLSETNCELFGALPDTNKLPVSRVPARVG